MTKWRPIDGDTTHPTEDLEDHSWTISLNKNPGWSTDDGYDGYGLPYDLAKWICDVLNESGKTCPYTLKYDTWEKKKKKQ